MTYQEKKLKNKNDADRVFVTVAISTKVQKQLAVASLKTPANAMSAHADSTDFICRVS